jgi:hypothetical protein
MAHYQRALASLASCKVTNSLHLFKQISILDLLRFGSDNIFEIIPDSVYDHSQNSAFFEDQEN